MTRQETETTMSFAHLTIATKDVAATSEFFQKTLRWRALEMPGNIDVDAAWLEISEGQQLHILGIPDAAPPHDAEFGRHYAFFYPGDDFDEVQSRLRQAGAEIVPAIRETPFRRIFFYDPNRYLFELIDEDGYAPEIK